MIYRIGIVFVLMLVCSSFTQAEGQRDGYNALTTLNGDWALDSADKQEGKATKNKIVSPLLGTGKTAMSFKVIGKGSAVQENLLPGTGKEMATMYHCDDYKNCNKVVAKHYCAKQNQPELSLMGMKGKTITFECNPANSTCSSKAGHVHQISHELSNGGKNLKTTYTIFKDGKKQKDSIYHFVKK